MEVSPHTSNNIFISISIFKTGVDTGTHILSQQRRAFKIRFLRFVHSSCIYLKDSFAVFKELKRKKQAGP